MSEQKTNEKTILSNAAKEIRRDILDIIHKSKSPHIGSSFSTVEILTALYFRILKIDPENPTDENRDRFIMSKGHGCPALYATLSHRGFFSREILEGFAIDGGTLEQHPTRNLAWGIEVSTGSLGHGLSIGVGMALGAKNKKQGYRTFVLMSDGECNEGSVWEAAMFAPKYRLDNLIAVIDYNKLQALGRTAETVQFEPFADKWKSFGWAVREIDGHDVDEIVRILSSVPFEEGKPSVIITHTIKGKGVSFMEDKLLWHYKTPDEGELNKALEELR